MQITWGMLLDFLNQHDFCIEEDGKGLRIFVMAQLRAAKQQQYGNVGLHKRHTQRPEIAVLPHILARFQRQFGVSPQHITGKEPWHMKLLPCAEV